MMPLFEKFLTSNETPNQIVVAENQEVGNDASDTPSFPSSFSEFSKLDKMGKSSRIYLT